VTTFTTWVGSKNFKWQVNAIRDKKSATQDEDEDEDEEGEGKESVADLVASLNACKRSGDPLKTGNVWPRVAEVSLCGALGCGAQVMRMQCDETRIAHHAIQHTIHTTLYSTPYTLYSDTILHAVGAVGAGSARAIYNILTTIHSPPYTIFTPYTILSWCRKCSSNS
jgi:hypothetical protein